MRKLIILLFAFFIVNFAFAQKNTLYSCNFNQIYFSDLIDSIQKETNFSIYYKSNWFDSLKVDVNYKNNTPLFIINDVLKNTSYMAFEYTSNQIVILKDDKLISEIPKYFKTNEVDENPQIANRYLSSRKAAINRTIIVGNKKSSQKYAVLRIKVLNAKNDEALAGAVIRFVETEKAISTGFNGQVSSKLKIGKHNIEISYLGMYTVSLTIDLRSAGSHTVYMFTKNIELKAIEVYGDKQMMVERKDPGIEKVTIKTMKEIPMMMGEIDLMKITTALPGIVNVGEGSAGINVRGGNYDQNAFYLNKIPIYNSTHLFGFFSAINSEIINDFTIYKGFIPVKYGGRLSSVIDVKSKTANMKKFSMKGGISPVSANLLLETPIIKDKLSLFVSGRSTYSDWILKRIEDTDISNSQANFYDFSTSAKYNSKNSHVELFAYHSSDNFDFSDISKYQYQNSGISFNLNHQINHDLKTEFLLVQSEYSFETFDRTFKEESYNHSFNINQSDLKLNFIQNINSNHKLVYGYNFSFYNLNRGLVEPAAYSNLLRIDLGNDKGMENSLFISDEFEVINNLKIIGGFRFSLFNPLGEKTVYKYTENRPKFKEFIADSILFSNNQIIKWYFNPLLRFSANYKLNNSGSFKLSFNQNMQSIFMLNSTIAVSPNSQWKLADYHLKPSKSNSFSLGYFRNLSAIGLEFSIEGFYKTTSEFTEFRDGADFLSNPNVESLVLQGKQQAYGLEFMVKRSFRDLTGWLAYTYSRSFVKVNGGTYYNRINGGKRYPSNYDIPHSVNTVLNYKLNKRVSFSSSIIFQSGRPITYPVSVYYVNDAAFVEFSERNEYRIPNYFRMDLSMTIEGNLKRDKLIHSSWVFNVYNVTSRDNPYSVFHRSSKGKISTYQYSVISVPVFTISWIFKLGNYASE